MTRGLYVIERGQNSDNTLMPYTTNFVFAYNLSVGAPSEVLDYGSVAVAEDVFLDFGSVAVAADTFLDYGTVLGDLMRTIDIADLRLTRPTINCLHFSSTGQFFIRFWDGVSFGGYVANPEIFALPGNVEAVEILSFDPMIITVEFWGLQGAIEEGVLRGGFSDGFSSGFQIEFEE